MFGTNTITGKKYFENAPSNSLFVTSIFFTLQGEGPYSGLPAVFVRLTRCNLTCSFCDTFFDDGDWLTYNQIDEKINETINKYFNGHPPKWALNVDNNHQGVVLVMTGGEPLLQNNISKFMKDRLITFRNVQVESNGIPSTEISEGVTLVCSPKCAEKDGKATKYFSPSKTILDRADCLKFVMSSDKNSPYNSIPDWAHDWKSKNPEKEIYISPMNIYNDLPKKIKILHNENGKITMEQRSTVDEVISAWEDGVLDRKENQLNHEYAAKYCIEHGFRFNMQTHLYASLP